MARFWYRLERMMSSMFGQLLRKAIGSILTFSRFPDLAMFKSKTRQVCPCTSQSLRPGTRYVAFPSQRIFCLTAETSVVWVMQTAFFLPVYSSV